MITQEKKTESLSIERARLSDIDGLIELLYKKYPSDWVKRISRRGLETYLEYSIGSPLCIILMARSDGDSSAGYIFATIDTNRFWRGFALRHPVTMLMMTVFRAERIIERRKEIKQAEGEKGDIPAFSWAPSGPEKARIAGILVREKHRGKGVATKLYFSLFKILKDRNCSLIEEYMGPDYCQYAGKVTGIGWQYQQVKGAGFKITKHLNNLGTE